MTTATVAPHAFTAHDRCDRCGAQAFLRAVLTSGDLLFCAHHGRAYGDALLATALVVEDASELINAKPSPSAY
jgi:ribosomal protein L37E